MNMLGTLQKIGRSLMTPIAVMPAAAILLRIGNIDFTKYAWSNNAFMLHLANVFAKGAGAIFDNMPLIFAIGVAIGFAEGAGVAGLAACIGYLVMKNVLGTFDVVDAKGTVTTHLDMGVLGGIIAGLIAAVLYNRYKDIRLPAAFGFFGGRRFVPIITSLTMVVLGVIFGLIWLPIQNAIEAFGNWIVSLHATGAFLYGLINRLLIPFGLHHIVNTIVWLQLGDFKNAAGQIIHGDLQRFFAGDKSAGMFMTGFFPIMMFGLPAACFAMVHEAKKEKREQAASILLSAALASFLTGVTEPIEFAFMFVAPVLYVVHAILTGLSMAITYMIGMHLGFGFSAGLTDYLLNWNLSTKPWLLIPVGIVYAIVYYLVFRAVIRMFKLKTPGREDTDEDIDGNVAGLAFAGAAGSANDANAANAAKRASSIRDKAEAILPLIGGADNIKNLDACVTRLRLILADESLVKEQELKRLGAAGIMRLGKGNVQIVFGTESELIKEEMKHMLK
jgi:N-acetylglucosamine PTS system EIICBA or EIICB component